MVIFFDLDDTGLVTLPTILQILKERHGEDLPIDTYLTPDNGGVGFIGLMEDGAFLPKTPIREGFIEAVDRIKSMGHQTGICSHRGYHRMGAIHTRTVLGDDIHKFDAIMYLDPVTTPCKLEALRETFASFDMADEEFIIIDDRPHFNAEFDQEDHDHIILFDQPWNRNLPFDRIHAFDEKFFELLSEKIQKLSNF